MEYEKIGKWIANDYDYTIMEWEKDNDQDYENYGNTCYEE